ncbi:MAG: transglycosylase domain-containing protein [Armatimonadetes bacterium]|nr:transglycosylase domain-containing protein [Armatimonadota bacterium]
MNDRDIERKPGRRWLRWLKITGVLTVTVGSLVFIVASAVWQKRLEDASKIVPNLADYIHQIDTKPSVIVSEDDQVLFQDSPQNRVYVTRDKIPTTVVNAILAAEDKRFYQHSGVDWYAFGRILSLFVREGKKQGASTLTMQIAKKVFTGDERSFDRKLNNMALATMMERMRTKDQIIEVYLNEMFFGHGAYGIAAAAKVYFDKSLDELTLGEAATLARCVRSPSRENPIDDLEGSKENRDTVLKVMREEDFITEEAYRNALAEPLKIKTRAKGTTRSGKRLPYFVDYVLLQELKEVAPEIDFASGGYRVETTVNTQLQAKVDEVFRKTLRAYRSANVNMGAFLCTDSDGKILAMIGGQDYGKEQYNLVTRAKLQPGSAFKPFVYSTAFENGVLSPYGEVNNGDYTIKDGRSSRKIKSGGPRSMVSVRSAFAQSYNNAAMWAQKEAGLSNVMQKSREAFGFKYLKDHVETTAIGANTVTMMEMASAYSVFQQEGYRVRPYAIRRIIGPNGEVLHEFAGTKIGRVVSVDTAKGIDYLMREVVTSGSGRDAIGVPNAHGKTGTTSDYKDAWFCGYTDRFVGIVWLASQTTRADGSKKRLAMDGVYGGQYSCPLWAKLMTVVQDTLGESNSGRDRRNRKVETPETDEPPVPPETMPTDVVAKPGPDKPETGAPTEETEEPKNGDQPADDGTTAPEVARTNPQPASPPKVRGLVYVEICADTGLKATLYCPERVRRAFVKGTEPKTRCTSHGG